MDTLQDMREALQNDLTVGDESSLFPPATIDLAINRAYRKIGALYRWPDTKDALLTDTLTGHEYYQYPKNWRPESIFKLTVDGTDFGEPLSFKDYMYEKENSMPSGFLRIWCNYGRRYFFYPITTENGQKNIAIFGFKFVDKMVFDGDITIFSFSLPDVNEAILLEANAILKWKGEVQQPVQRTFISGSLLLSAEALNIVNQAWVKIAQEQARLVRTTPQFDVPDFFASRADVRRSIKRNIGNF